MNLDRWLPRILGALVLGGIAGAVAFAALSASSVPDGPVDVVWDKAACAHCRMHLGEPAFAAQLITTAGDVLLFDDPGCLFAHVAAAAPAAHATWFHDHDRDRWLTPAEVAFAPVPTSPMGYCIGAVPKGTPGALELEAARARCLQPTSGGPR